MHRAIQDLHGARPILRLDDPIAEFFEHVADEHAKLETDLTASAKVEAKVLHLGAEGARKLTEEQLVEVRESGRRVVFRQKRLPRSPSKGSKGVLAAAIRPNTLSEQGTA